jgi:riboflavin synthase
MFSGIVEGVASVAAVWDGPNSRKLTLATEGTDWAVGQSLAVNGCCLTIAEIMPGKLVFDVVRETLDKTNLGLLEAGSEVNIERPLRLGDRLDGHFVQGHIDGTALLLESICQGTDRRLKLQTPPELAKYLAPKGSVSLDGVSLTIASLEQTSFEVSLIPTTLARTTLGKKTPNWPLNLEADILSKTVVSWLERQTRGAARLSSPKSSTAAK